VPSVYFLAALHDTHKERRGSVAKSGVRNDRIFYILNPNRDVNKTQARLEEPFREQFHLGQGVVGQWPSSDQVTQALSSMDAFMYCGHGSSIKTLRSQEIERLHARAVPLLFGCNSGRLDRLGRSFDPVGCAHSYLIATAPCLLGFLWSVTGKLKSSIKKRWRKMYKINLLNYYKSGSFLIL